MPANLICEDCKSRGSCQEPWEKHLAQLQRDPEPHWHRCPEGHLCGVVPVMAHHVCVAALRLLVDGRAGDEEFQRDLGLLELLAECCVLRHGDVLERTITPLASAEASGLQENGLVKNAENRGSLHPQVAAAIGYVGRHLTDSQLSVEHIAHALEINSTYLGHLFAQQLGVRLHEYVTRRRMELAKQLLVTTDRQIKRIARETGHRNASWFSQVFRAETGLTPTAYRRRHKS
jgi:AraC-like DNA-binding protein